MWEYTLLRGKVTAHLDDEKKGLVEVSLGGYDKDGDKLHARVEQNMAGIYWLPEIGDVVEVFVPDSPGYEAHVLRVRRREGDEQAAECWTETNDRKQIKTRSGHTITLDDTQDKTSLMIQSAGGLQWGMEDETLTVTVRGKDADTPKLLMDIKNDEIKLSAGQKLTVACGGASLEMDSSGNISIKAAGNLELIGKEIILNAQNRLTAKGQEVEIASGMTTKIAGQTQLELSSSGITEVKGKAVKLN